MTNVVRADPFSSKSTILCAALLVGAIVATWSGSFDGPFVLDDVLNIEHNETIRDWRHAFSPPADSTAGGRPILNFSFAVNHALGGTAVRGLHVVNLGIHVAAALTLFGLVRRTLLTAPLRARYETAALPLATAIALLWALHPLQTASVTYLSQRAESLMGLFYLLVLYCVVRGWKVAAVVACALGVGTKEVIVTAPLAVLLYDRTFLAGSFRAAWQQRRGLYLGLLGATALLAFLLAGIQLRGVANDSATTPLSYALVECRVLVSYLKLSVWPYPLVFDYGQFARDFPASLACGLVLAVLLAGIAWALVRRPALGFVSAWFFLVLAPTSSVVPVAFQPMGENRMYLPLIAVVALGVVGIHAVWPKRFLTLAGATALVLAALTIHRNLEYRDPLRLWADTLARRPDNFRAQNEYAIALGQAGRPEEAIPAIERALARKPDASLLQRNLGLLLMQQGRVQEALPHFATVVRLEPQYARGHRDYARALVTAGKRVEAIAEFRALSALEPASAGPHAELGILLLQAGQLDAALAEFEIANRLDPENAASRYNHGLALTHAGRTAEALTQFEAAVRLDANSAGAHFALANTLVALGRLPEAMPHYTTTLKLDPNYPQARQFYELARARLAP
jgi:tetratricopeptide (TPR) repeat protein